MSSSKRIFAALLILLPGCSSPVALATGVCPPIPDHPLQFVDVFDGSPEELATLVPDKAKAQSGYWQLGYVYDAGRFVTIRCKYADGKVTDVKLSGKVQQCSYGIDAKKTLTLSCK